MGRAFTGFCEGDFVGECEIEGDIDARIVGVTECLGLGFGVGDKVLRIDGIAEG